MSPPRPPSMTWTLPSNQVDFLPVAWIRDVHSCLRPSSYVLLTCTVPSPPLSPPKPICPLSTTHLLPQFPWARGPTQVSSSLFWWNLGLLHLVCQLTYILAHGSLFMSPVSFNKPDIKLLGNESILQFHTQIVSTPQQVFHKISLNWIRQKWPGSLETGSQLLSHLHPSTCTFIKAIFLLGTNEVPWHSFSVTGEGETFRE